jgi:hypothetical protein
MVKPCNVSLQRRALCFQALFDGFVRWMKPRSTSLLLGTIADLANRKSELLVENALCIASPKIFPGGFSTH